jgi:PleD family two-component response regulator
MRRNVGDSIAPLTEGVVTLEPLLEAADAELYRAKKAGGNRIAATGMGGKGFSR